MIADLVLVSFCAHYSYRALSVYFQTYHKKMQTPARWASKHVHVRSFATQTTPSMVDRSTQYHPPQPEQCELPPAPFIFRGVEEDMLDTSFRSDGSTCTMEDDSDDPDYDPHMDMEAEIVEDERYICM